MAAPDRALAFSAAASASRSTTVPRALLMKMAPVFMRAISRAPIMPCVAGVSGTCSVTTSALASSSSRLSAGSTLPWRSLSVWS